MILAANNWRSNADLILDCKELGYLKEEDLILDLTYGNGKFWTKWFPKHLTAADINPTQDFVYKQDFRNLSGWRSDNYDVVVFDPPYVCVSLDTEILTKRGWLTWNKVIPKVDETLTLNKNTGLAEWQIINEINVYPATPYLIELNSNAHSSLTTPNHRWPVLNKRKKLPYQWDKTDKFRADSIVPICTELQSLPVKPKYPDSLVEVLGWFWTEGNVERKRNGELGAYSNIVQKFDNIQNCNLIRSALTKLFGPPVNLFPRTGRKTDGIPRWRESRDNHKAVFWLSADAGRILLEYAPEKIPSYDFLLNLTKEQLELFIKISLAADGHKYNIGSLATLGHRNRAAAETFQFALILAGYATSIKPIKDPLGIMWLVRIRSQKFFKPSRASTQRIICSSENKVWCPSVPNETWLARRNGTVYYTGNSTGGRSTSTITDFNSRYGLTEAAKTPQLLQEYNNKGFTAVTRLVKKNGFILVKCKDYISSGKYFAGTHYTLQHGLDMLGLELQDRFEMIGSPRMQPKRTRKDGKPSVQQHARRNLSTLLVFKK